MKITWRAGSKNGLCMMNNTTNIFVVLDLIVLQNGNNLLKMHHHFGGSSGKGPSGCLGPAAITALLISKFTMIG